MQVIVNADDLGMSANVNEAIFELIAAGRISSATLMANGPAMREAAARLHLFPHCSFGVHLNLTQFQPLTGGDGAKVLTNGSGQLSRDIETASPTMAPRAAPLARSPPPTAGPVCCGTGGGGAAGSIPVVFFAQVLHSDVSLDCCCEL